jgi:hypothetical protein|tara:strand:+ start:740 stop:979 length:240 start_codon:yes stop_codon:yes gene_type:complete
MRASRGMGAILPSKMPKGKTMRRKDGDTFQMFAEGGLYENINKKRKRIAAGSGEKMRKVGSTGAPSAFAFKQSAKTAKK